MAIENQALFWTVIGVVVSVLLVVIPLVVKIMIGPRVRFGTPFRDARAWVPRSYAPALGTEQPYVVAAGTAGNDAIAYQKAHNPSFAFAASDRYYIHIPVKNDTAWRFEQCVARNARAELEFFGLESKLGLGRFNGKWEHSDQLSIADNKGRPRGIDIPAGQIESLDIVSRKIDGTDWYVMNDSSYDNPGSSEIPANRIGAGGFIVRIIVDGDNFDSQEIIYRVIDNGNAEPKYTLLKKRELKP